MVSDQLIKLKYGMEKFLKYFLKVRVLFATGISHIVKLIMKFKEMSYMFYTQV